MKPLGPLLLLLFCRLYALPQQVCNFAVSGRVTDHHNGEVLVYALVRAQGTNLAALTDTGGYYRIEGLCPGTYVFECTHVGCDPVVQSIFVDANLILNFNPEHHTELLHEFEMSTYRSHYEGSVNKEVISHSELQLLKGLSFTESLKDVKGMAILSTGSTIGKPVIRGMSGNRVVIMNNGIKQESQQWGTEHAPELDPSLAEEIEIVKGASTVLYGPEAMGGVVLMKTRSMATIDAFRTEFSTFMATNGFAGGVSFFTEGKLPVKSKWVYRINGALRRSGTMRTPDYYLKNTGLFEWNGSWNFAHFGKKYGVEAFYSYYSFDVGIFSAAHLGNLSDLKKAIASDRPIESGSFTYAIERPRQEVKHELTLVRGYVFAGRQARLSYDLSRQYNLRKEYDKHLPLNDSLAGLDPASLHLEITTWTANIKYEFRHLHKLFATVGLSSSLQGNTYEGRFFIPNYSRINSGLYLLERYVSSNGKLYVEGGIRIDNLDQQVYMRSDTNIVQLSKHFINPSWSLSTGLKHSEMAESRLFVASAWRAPHVSEWYSNGIHHGTATYESGNPDLGAEKSFMTGAFISIKPGLFEFSLEPYYSRMNGFINLEPDQKPILTIRGAFPSFRYVQQDVNLYGSDFFANYKLPRMLSISCVASIVRARRISDETFIYGIPSDRLTLRIRKGFNISQKWQNGFVLIALPYVAKQWRVNSIYDYAVPPDAYFLINASCGIQRSTRHGPVQVGLDISNALNNRYRDYLDRFRYFTDAKGFSIQLRISIPFLIPSREEKQVEIQNTNQ